MNTNATPIRSHGGLGYACCFCSKRFPCPGELKKHTIESHEEIYKFNFIRRLKVYKCYIKLDITALKCNICHANLDTLEFLIEHLNRAHDRKLYTDIKNQILPFKFPDDRLQCFMCNNIYYKFKSLLQHMNTHYRNYVCEVCGAGFVCLAILSKHTNCHNLGNFKCGYCDKEFNTNQKRRYHEKYVHTKSILFNKCQICNEKFKDYRIKEKHVVDVHGVKPLTINCQACDKSFKSQKDLGLHVRKIHLMYKRHKCTECDMAFFSTAELRNHYIKHTGIRQFQCDVCHKSYARKKTLREHLRIHADDRRFKCEHCGQAFVQKCSWRGHMRCKHNEEV